MRTLTKFSAVALSLGLVFAACGGDDDGDEADNTTSTTAPTSTTSTTAALKSESAVAVALNDSILDGQKLQAALELSAQPGPFPGTATAPPPPQGPLTLDGVAKVYPSDAYKGLLENAKASVGANKTYLIPSGYVVNILAVKFPTGADAGTFVKSAGEVATTFGGAKVNAHPELKVGLAPEGSVIVVPPASGATNENVVASAFYAEGVFYQVSASAPPGTIKDDVIIAILKAQDALYKAKKASIPAS